MGVHGVYRVARSLAPGKVSRRETSAAMPNPPP